MAAPSLSHDTTCAMLCGAGIYTAMHHTTYIWINQVHINISTIFIHVYSLKLVASLLCFKDFWLNITNKSRWDDTDWMSNYPRHVNQAEINISTRLHHSIAHKCSITALCCAFNCAFLDFFGNWLLRRHLDAVIRLGSRVLFDRSLYCCFHYYTQWPSLSI